MKDKFNFNYFLVVILSVTFLIVIFIFVNNGTINTKVIDKSLDKVTENISIPTSTYEVVNKITINVDGIPTEVVIDKMDSYLGFSINYDSDNIRYDVLSNSSVLFSDINNKKNYFKIIKLSESDYNTKYELSKNNELHENEIESNSYNYSFYRIGENYFEIIESLDKNDDFNIYLNAVFKYMISTLKEH